MYIFDKNKPGQSITPNPSTSQVERNGCVQTPKAAVKAVKRPTTETTYLTIQVSTALKQDYLMYSAIEGIKPHILLASAFSCYKKNRAKKNNLR